MKKMILQITTDTSGDCTVTGERALLGKLFAVEYICGDLLNTADFVLTCESGVSSKPLLTVSLTNANAWLYPRDLAHAVANGAALTGTAGGDRVMPILAGKPKLIVAQGSSGAAANGKFILYFEN
jgi:hypothetical protein